ncbi:MAG: hypothetical protein AAFX99_16110, partial [Myxococcota bacterium]
MLKKGDPILNPTRILGVLVLGLLTVSIGCSGDIGDSSAGAEGATGGTTVGGETSGGSGGSQTSSDAGGGQTSGDAGGSETSGDTGGSEPSDDTGGGETSGDSGEVVDSSNDTGGGHACSDVVVEPANVFTAPIDGTQVSSATREEGDYVSLEQHHCPEQVPPSYLPHDWTLGELADGGTEMTYGTPEHLNCVDSLGQLVPMRACQEDGGYYDFSQELPGRGRIWRGIEELDNTLIKDGMRMNMEAPFDGFLVDALYPEGTGYLRVMMKTFAQDYDVLDGYSDPAELQLPEVEARFENFRYISGFNEAFFRRQDETL